MPRIFDNIEDKLLPTLKQTLECCDHADFCVGYFNMRGWSQLHDCIEKWSGGEGHCCRLLVGMQKPPQDQLRQLMGTSESPDFQMDQATAIGLKKRIAQEFRDQLVIGVPTNADKIKGELFDRPELRRAINDIYKYPLLSGATDTLNRQLKSGIDDPALAELVMALRDDMRLCRVTEDTTDGEPQVICSLGLRKDEGVRMKAEE